MKLIKGVNAVQIHCRMCDCHQLVPKNGPKVCRECGAKASIVGGEL